MLPILFQVDSSIPPVNIHVLCGFTLNSIEITKLSLASSNRNLALKPNSLRAGPRAYKYMKLNVGEISPESGSGIPCIFGDLQKCVHRLIYSVSVL